MTPKVLPPRQQPILPSSYPTQTTEETTQRERNQQPQRTKRSEPTPLISPPNPSHQANNPISQSLTPVIRPTQPAKAIPTKLKQYRPSSRPNPVKSSPHHPSSPSSLDRQDKTRHDKPKDGRHSSINKAQIHYHHRITAKNPPTARLHSLSLSLFPNFLPIPPATNISR